jgi:hypothetical protein
MVCMVEMMLSRTWTVEDSCPQQLGYVNRVAANVGQLGTLNTSSADCLAWTTGVPTPTDPRTLYCTPYRLTLFKSTCESKML